MSSAIVLSPPVDLMKVSPETITVIADKEQPELLVLMGGHRITLSLAEARVLVDALEPAIAQRMGGAHDLHGEASSASDAACEPVAPEFAAAQPQPENATIIAKVTEQLVSWSQIATALNSRK